MKEKLRKSIIVERKGRATDPLVISSKESHNNRSLFF